MAAFPHLLAPLALGPVTAPNRIVSSGHDTVMVDHGRITDQLVAYHEARARGGAGMIVVQVAGVHPSARYTSHILMADDDGCVPGFARLAAAVAPYATVLVGQLFHPGREVAESPEGPAPVARAPSARPTERFLVMPRALTAAEIAEIVDAYGAAAARLVAAGLAGVEVVASHGYLPAQFLNPHANVRTDAYGGGRRERRRFLAEVLTSVRAHVGPGAVVGLRLSLDEHDPAGLPAPEAAAAAVALASEGLLDYLSVTTGTSATRRGSGHIVPEMSQRPGYVAGAAGRLRAQVRVPVMVAGRINQPQDAERILAAGEADACVMTRALICDPEMPAKAAAGRHEEIRACVACNQACIGHFQAGVPISCIQHPETGRELRYGARRPARARRDVLVVGAGPAGLKAAAVAGERGHRVRILEAASVPGGQVRLAARLPGRDEFAGVIDNLLGEARRAGATPELGRHVDADDVARAGADVVVVATGARPYRPDLEILGDPAVLSAWEVLEDPARCARGRWAVVDWRGDWVGVGMARLLAQRGSSVVLATPGYGAGESLQQYVRDVALAALARAGVEVVPLVRPFGIDDDTLYLQHVLTEEPVVCAPVAGVVLATGHQANDELLVELAARGVAAVGIGDCLAPRSVEEAVLEALIAAAEI
ncbi:MAG: FAD-dependent oxidoreductase [Acidimicrobiales bacterium]